MLVYIIFVVLIMHDLQLSVIDHLGYVCTSITDSALIYSSIPGAYVSRGQPSIL